jgi:hypothetical protein
MKQSALRLLKVNVKLTKVTVCANFWTLQVRKCQITSDTKVSDNGICLVLFVKAILVAKMTELQIVVKQ